MGRPVSDEAKRQADEDLSAKNDPPSVKMSGDVCMIAQQQRQREQQLKNAAVGNAESFLLLFEKYFYFTMSFLLQDQPKRKKEL